MMQDSDLDAEPESSAADSRPVAPKLAAAAFLQRRSGPVMASDSEYGKPEGLGEYSGHDIRHSLGPGPNLNREPPGRFDQGSIPLDGHVQWNHDRDAAGRAAPATAAAPAGPTPSIMITES
jgi:hypothetical protein